MDRWVDGQIDIWIDGQIAQQMDGWVDGQIDRQIDRSPPKDGKYIVASTQEETTWAQLFEFSTGGKAQIIYVESCC